ncbi:MAG: GNAT family N-acetyltransferase [Rhizobiaceae bacterium]
MTLEKKSDEASFLIKGAGDGNADILVRPIEAADRHLLQLGFDQLSERSRYFRFLMRRDALTKEELDFLTAKNTEDHVALGALDLCCDPPRPVGIARYVRNEDAPQTAEIAITISDRYQGRGLGTTLVCALAFKAVLSNFTHFTALVHQENEVMLRIFRKLGGHAEPASTGEVTVQLPILEQPDDYPSTGPGNRMREVYGALSPAT